MTTYAEAKAMVNATAVFWAEISGIPWAGCDGLITESNKSTLFTDSKTPARTFIKCLEIPKDSFGRSMELHSAEASVGGFSVSFTDVQTDAHPDGHWTWVFGSERSDIARTRLDTNVALHVGGAGHDWSTEGVLGGGFSGFPLYIYCELETALADNEADPLFTDVSRAQFQSPATPHKSNVYGIFPEVTDHPTQWAGRIVTLFQTYMDGDGSLASTDGTAATARAAAHKWRGVLRDVTYRDNTWTLRCDSLDTLLKRQCVRGQPEAEIATRVDVQKLVTNGVDIGGTVCSVTLVDPTGAVDEHGYWGAITEGIYTRESFTQALNNVWQQGVATDEDGNTNTWRGQLTFSWEPEGLRIIYHTAAVAADVRQAIINLGENVVSADDGANFDTFSYWQQLGVTADNATYITPGEPVADTDYAFYIDAAAALEVDLAGHRRRTVMVAPADQLGGIAGASSFSEGDAAAVISDAGVTPCTVLAVDAANGLIRIRRIPELDPFGLVHVGTETKPIKLRKAFYCTRAQNELGMAGPGIADPALRLLLSSGLSAYNHTNYDVDDEGIGIAFPHDSPMASSDSTEALLDVTAFLDFFGEAEAYVASVLDFIYEPTEMRKWLTQRVGFLGGFVTVINGQLTVRRGVAPLISDAQHTIAETELLPGWSVDLGQIATIDGVVFKHDWSMADREYMLTTTAIAGDETGGTEPQNRLTWEDKGIRTDRSRLFALASAYLYDFGTGNRILSGATDRVHWNVEPGQVVRFSDDGDGDDMDDTRKYLGLPNPDGTRGFSSGASSARMVAMSVTASPADGTTQLKLIHVTTRRSGYAPSAWIESYTNVGNAVLTCTAQFFRPTADGVDVGAFTVGDKVRVVSANPTQAGADPGLETGEGGLTIQSINETASTITLTGTLAVAWPSPPAAASQCIYLMLDPYQTASQTDAAKEWAHVGDSSGDVGDTTEDAFQW